MQLQFNRLLITNEGLNMFNEIKQDLMVSEENLSNN